MSWRENLGHYPDPRTSAGLSYQGVTYPGLIQDPGHGYPPVLAGAVSPLMRPMVTSPYPQPMLPVGATFPPSSPYVGPGMVGGMLSHPRPPSSPFMSPQSVVDLQRSVIPGPDPRLMSPPMLDLYSPPPPPLGLGGHRLRVPSPVSIGMPGSYAENSSLSMLPPPPPLKHAPGVPQRPRAPSSASNPNTSETPHTIHSQLWSPQSSSESKSANSGASREKTDDLLALNESYSISAQQSTCTLNPQSSKAQTKASSSLPDVPKIKKEVDAETSEDYRMIGDKYLCNRCNYVSPRPDKIVQHIQAHKGKKVCHLCNKAFIKSCDLHRHLERHNKNRYHGNRPPNVPKPFNSTTNTDAIQILRENLGSSQDSSQEEDPKSNHDDQTVASGNPSPSSSSSSDKSCNDQETNLSHTENTAEDMTHTDPVEDCEQANQPDPASQDEDVVEVDSRDGSEARVMLDAGATESSTIQQGEQSGEKVQDKSSNLQIQDVRSYAGSSSQFDSQTASAVNTDDDVTSDGPLVPLPEYTPIAGSVIDVTRFNIPNPASPLTSPLSDDDEPPMLSPPQSNGVNPSMSEGPPKLQKQRKTQHPSDYRCGLCNYEGRSEKSLQKHIRAHNQSYKICRYCSKAFERPSDLLRHEERHESNMQKNDGNPSIISKGKILGVSGDNPQMCETPEEQVFRCKKCDYTTNRYHILVLHQRQRHSAKYNCGNCGMIFISKRPLMNHLRHCVVKPGAVENPLSLIDTANQPQPANPALPAAMPPGNPVGLTTGAIPMRNWPSATESMPLSSMPAHGLPETSHSFASTSQTQRTEQVISRKDNNAKKKEHIETKGIGRLDCFKKDILERTKLVEIVVDDDNEICLSMEPVSEVASTFSEAEIPFCSRHTEARNIIDHAKELNRQDCDATGVDTAQGTDKRTTRGGEHTTLAKTGPIQKPPSPILISPSSDALTEVIPSMTNSTTPMSPRVLNVFTSMSNNAAPKMPVLVAPLPTLIPKPTPSGQTKSKTITLSNALGSPSVVHETNQPQIITSEYARNLQIVHVEGKSQHRSQTTRNAQFIRFPQHTPTNKPGIAPVIQIPSTMSVQKSPNAQNSSIVIRIADAVQLPSTPKVTTILHMKKTSRDSPKTPVISTASPVTKHTPEPPTQSSSVGRMYPETSINSVSAQSSACTNDHNYHTSPEKLRIDNPSTAGARRMPKFVEVTSKRKSDASENPQQSPKVKKLVHDMIPAVDIKQEPKSDIVQLMRPNVYRHKQLKHYCERCNYGTDEKHKMDEHLRAHEGRFVCKHCNKACIKASDLYRHWVTHNLRAPNGEYICDTCEFTCPTKHGMETHLRVHYVLRLNPLAASHNIATCGLCNRKFTRSQLFVHKRLVHGKQARNMTSAAASLRAARGWSSHGRPPLNQPAFPVENTGEAPGTSSSRSTSYWCPMCDQQFETATAINNHYDSAHLDNNNVDGTVTLDPLLLDGTSEKVPNQRTTVRKSPGSPKKRRTKRGCRKFSKSHSCKFCHKRFSTIYYKREHERLHTDEKPYSCSKCGERFVLKQACRMHESRNCSIRRERHHLRASDIQTHEAAYDESTDIESGPEGAAEILESLEPIDKEGESLAMDGTIDPDDLALIQSLPLPAPSIEIVTD